MRLYRHGGVRLPSASMPVAGSGDIAFRLMWDGPADLDLHVEDPEGELLSFVRRRTDSGGLLDVDCNSGPEDICPRPLENVFWPTMTAPEGRYRYWVELFQSPEEIEEVRFQLEVLLGKTPVVVQRGALSEDQSQAGPFEYAFEREP